VQAFGHFTNNRSYPGRTATGTIMTLLLTPKGFVTSYSLSDQALNLGKLGPVTRLLPDVYHATSSVATQLDQLAIDTANWAGDPNVSSVTWVATTRGAALTAQGGGEVGDPSDPVYLLEIQGSFILNVSTPVAGEAPTCGAFVFMYFQNNFNNAGRDCLAVGQPEVDLSTLGTPETDNLVGLSPKTVTRPA
jgi:hypothetical protein